MKYAQSSKRERASERSEREPRESWERVDTEPERWRLKAVDKCEPNRPTAKWTKISTSWAPVGVKY